MDLMNVKVDRAVRCTEPVTPHVSIIPDRLLETTPVVIGDCSAQPLTGTSSRLTNQRASMKLNLFGAHNKSSNVVFATNKNPSVADNSQLDVQSIVMSTRVQILQSHMLQNANRRVYTGY